MTQELTINPTPLRFSMSQEEAFLEELSDLDKHSIMYPLDDPSEIILDTATAEAGSGKHKFKLTTMALYQLCFALCPGMYGFVRALSGIHRMPDEPRSEYSFEESVDIINKVIRMRFNSKLRGKVLLRNTKHSTIEGVLTPTYKWLSNLRLYELAKKAIDQCQPKQEFFEAQLNGRWMLLRFCAKEPYFKFDGPQRKERFYNGYHFSNDELGRAAVRGAPFLLRKEGLTVALSTINNREYPVRHLGSTFEQRLDKLLTKSIDKTPIAANCLAATTALFDVNLGLGSKQYEDEKKTRKWLSSKLVRHDVPLPITKKIVGSLCMQPSCSSLLTVDYRSSDRTAFDLLAAIGREAKYLPIRYREATEELAYMLLFGEIDLTPQR